MLHQYHGNDMELLRDLACEGLARDPPPPLVLEQVVVPNVGMAKWLRQGIAERLGIAAQTSFDLPAQFIGRLASAVLGPGDAAVARAYAKDQLEIRIMGLLPGLLPTPGFEPLRDYLQDRRDPRRLLALSRQLAALYDQYLVYRLDWMLAWEQGHAAPQLPEREDPWQPVLWRAVCGAIRFAFPGAMHGAARNARLLEALQESVAPPGLPARVTGFGLGALSPALLALFAALGRHADVHLFQFNPCREFWGDIVSERRLARWSLLAESQAEHAEVGNALLASWGGLGREQLQLLLEGTEGELHACFRPAQGSGVLTTLQNDILDLVHDPAPRTLAPDEQGIVFAEAHSRLREVEALHDALLELFERLPGLAPREVVVMAPEIALYAGHVEAVFGGLRSTPRFVPFTIADRAEAGENPVARSFLHLLGLPDSRFSAPEIAGLLGVAALAERAGLDAADVEALRTLIARSGIRWGLDESASAGAGPGIARNTWRFGLRRLLLGAALEEGAVFAGIAPLTPQGSGDLERIGLLAEFIDRAADWARRLAGERSPAAWREAIEQLLCDFFAATSAYQAELAELRAAIAAVFETLQAAEFTADLPREALLDLLAGRLEQADGAHGFLRGGVSFCQLTPLRSIPFRVVCLLGMNADAFPRQRERAGFDLMGRARRLGDPSRRDDDRYLFLESVLAARDCLYISHVGRDERTDAEREPAVPLSELRDYLDVHWGEGAAARLTRVHRLKPFHADYFNGETKLFSYRVEWLAALRVEAAPPAFCTAALAPLVPAAISPAALAGFFRNPCKGFFNGRFALQFEDPQSLAEDCEPFALDGLGLYALKSALAAGAIEGRDAAVVGALEAEGSLPLGAAGRALMRKQCSALEDLVQRVRAWEADAPRSIEVAFACGGWLLQGALGGLRGSALREYTVSAEARAPALIAFWVRHLVACASRAVSAPSEFCDMKQTHTLALIEPATALAQLERLIMLQAEGLRRPLPLFPEAALAWARKLADGGDGEQAMAAARKAFLPQYQRRGESEELHIARAFPDPDAALDPEFEALAGTVFGPLAAALLEAPE